MGEILSPLLAFWNRVAENPADAGARMVFCDWLEEAAGDSRDAGRRRALEVVLAGQRWQVANARWPEWHGYAPRGWLWLGYYKDGEKPERHCCLPQSVLEGMPKPGESWQTGRLYPRLADAEWAIAVALDRLAWQERHEKAKAELAAITAPTVREAMHQVFMYGRATVPNGLRPEQVAALSPALIERLLDYEPPAPPFG